MIRHIVLFKFYPCVSEKTRKSAIEMLRKLPSLIPDIRNPNIGEEFQKKENRYYLAQIFDFNDQEALKRYEDHEEHKKIQNVFKEIADWMKIDYKFD